MTNWSLTCNYSNACQLYGHLWSLSDLGYGIILKRVDIFKIFLWAGGESLEGIRLFPGVELLMWVFQGDWIVFRKSRHGGGGGFWYFYSYYFFVKSRDYSGEIDFFFMGVENFSRGGVFRFFKYWDFFLRNYLAISLLMIFHGDWYFNGKKLNRLQGCWGNFRVAEIFSRTSIFNSWRLQKCSTVSYMCAIVIVTACL